MIRRRGERWCERGVVGGVEVLPFSLLVFVAGTLLLANAWGVVDAKLAATSAAREGVRAHVEAAPGRGADAGRQAALDSYRSGGRDPGTVVITSSDPGDRRCGTVRYEVRAPVPAIRIPIIGGFGHGTTVVGRHREVVDPFASGRTGSGDCDG